MRGKLELRLEFGEQPQELVFGEVHEVVRKLVFREARGDTARGEKSENVKKFVHGILLGSTGASGGGDALVGIQTAFEFPRFHLKIEKAHASAQDESQAHRKVCQ